MPPQKTQPAQPITDGDTQLAVLIGLIRHAIEELHNQNKAIAQLDDRLGDISGDMRVLTEVVEEARPLLESPAAKWFAQRRAFKPKAAPGG